MVAVGEDVAPLVPLTARDAAAARLPKTVVSPCSFDFSGWTNGFYAGTPATVAALMSAFADLSRAGLRSPGRAPRGAPDARRGDRHRCYR